MRDALAFFDDDEVIHSDDHRFEITVADLRAALAARSEPGAVDRTLYYGDDRDIHDARSEPGAEGLREALAHYRANPLDVNDRPESWRALDELLDACDAALAETEPKP